MFRRFKEWYSIRMAKHPQQMIVLIIAVVNICFFIVAAIAIRWLSMSDETATMGFWAALYYTITMILDAGCIESVVTDIGEVRVALVILCLLVVLIGTITFTGAVIGTFTNTLSEAIEKSNSGSRKLYISNHLVILNWNSRASEIINDLLFCEGKQHVVVLTENKKNEIEKEISERLADTINRENTELERLYKKLNLGPIARRIRFRREHLRNNVIYIVREGDVFSSKQLRDICLEHARSVVILGNDLNNSGCQFAVREKVEEASRGNAQTIKTLMQVSDITGSDDSDDDQKIIVEISEDWTAELVSRIVKNKKLQQDNDKNNIVPVRVNRILGQILSQFSLMPELNKAYNDLFSNKGATFFVKEWKPARRDPLIQRAKELLYPGRDNLSQKELERVRHRADILYIDDYLNKHRHAIPLGSMELEEIDGRTGKKELKHYFYYSADSLSDVNKADQVKKEDFTVSINRDYWIDKKRVIILGHNAGCEDIMKGFAAFCGEWDPDGTRKILEIVVIDDKEHLERVNRYKDYPFVVGTREATIYDKTIICDTIDWFMDYGDEENGDVSVLILSDDNAPNDSIDANALANLVYVQDIIAEKKISNPQFDTESIDIVVELINPKHHDIVNNYSISRYIGDETHSSDPQYSINNVVISNRFISKMVTQIGEKEAIFDFYTDILTYDQADAQEYESKEVYAKKVSAFFNELPPKCTEGQLIRAVWNATKDWHPTVVLGYVKPGGIVRLFCGDQDNEENAFQLEKNDKLIVFTDH